MRWRAGGPKEIRTPNPLVANEVRYRYAMGPNLIKKPRLGAGSIPSRGATVTHANVALRVFVGM